MKNEDLSYKIRELLGTSDQTDPDWDPDKFWNLFEARKRRRKRWVVLSYSMAAVVIFAILHIIVTGESIKKYTDINSKVSAIPQRKTPSLPNKQIGEIAIARTENKSQPDGFKISGKKDESRFSGSNIKSKRALADEVQNYVNNTKDALRQRTYVSDQLMKEFNPISKLENEEMPSLLQMFEQAQREREQRNLSVHLDNQANYNSFWLTVNQHLLANKLNSDQLHYERY
ncbi:hypothetical protein [Dyadobacter sp. CY326]|uniref:hypothetical protein n=1 Tax=Dyadobacter sp. CY326 TaxID=2907300 RepID=UPI001F3D5D0D|nr:hypothetical protein [Dyadobacter sp. CY326]MCE7067071.1 hypothetical protein [Dyadobacter sp. CY326]